VLNDVVLKLQLEVGLGQAVIWNLCLAAQLATTGPGGAR
jgi:hypothetical protein